MKKLKPKNGPSDKSSMKIGSLMTPKKRLTNIIENPHEESEESDEMPKADVIF